MKLYRANSGEGLEGLMLTEGPEPEPGPREVVVRVRANSLSFRELNILRGNYPLPVKPDVIPISDGAGEVVSVGAAVTRAAVGDRVAAAVFPEWIDGPFSFDFAAQIGGSLDGMLAEYVRLPETAVVQVPAHLSFPEAATLPCAAVTAWHALTGGQGVRAGETVLTLGSGGVSLFALQFSKMFGAEVIATTGSAKKAKKLAALGADCVIDYAKIPGWEEEAKRLTQGRGVDHVIDVTGMLEQSLKAVTASGEVAFVGMLSPDAPAARIDPAVLFNSVASIRVVALGSRAHFVAMNRAIAAARLRPVIDRAFAFADASEAYRYYETARPFGKVVIVHEVPNLGRLADAEETLRSAYRAFNARDIEAAIELMHPEVDWPNAWEGGRVVGHAAVRDYWTRQFEALSSRVEPEGFIEEPDGRITVDVHQVVHDARTGELISDSRVRHRYRLEDGLVVRMDVLEAPGQQ
jgi:NADPH:quinone reductase-like Zn-dependent oxidoreductase/ketosteroid isomerase-like protein